MENLKTEVIKKQGCKVSLKIHVPKEEVDKELKSAYDKVKNTVNVSGFRKGKIPMEIVKTRYVSEAKGYALDNLIQNSLKHAFKQNDIKPVSSSDVKEMKNLPNEGEDFLFTIETEIIPEFKLPNYNKLKLNKELKRVTDNDVDEKIEMLRQKSAVLIPVEKEVSEDKDYVVIDYTGHEDGGNNEVVKGKGQMFLAGDEEFLGGFGKNLLGLKKGMENEFTMDFPNDYFEKKLAGKKICFKVILNEIKHKSLPEINETFLKEIGEDSIETLKKKIKDSLEIQEKNNSEEKLRVDLMDEIVNLTPFEVPSSLVENQLKHLVEHYIRLYEYRTGADKSSLDQEELKKKYQPIAEKQVKGMIILERLAEEEKIEVEELDINLEKEKNINAAPNKKEEILKYFNDNLDDIKHKIRDEKIFNFLLKNAKIKTVQK